MKKIICFSVLLLFVYLIPVLFSHNIYTGNLNCADCQVWASHPDAADFTPLTERGFVLRHDASNTFFRAIKDRPSRDDIFAASLVQRKTEARGGFATLELTGKSNYGLPEKCEIVNVYSETGMRCTEFVLNHRSYQIAVRGEKTIIGTPAISVGY